MKKVIFQSNLSRGYNVEETLKISLKLTEDEYNKISLMFQKYKKIGIKSNLIETFIKDYLMKKIEEELQKDANL